jgi:endonuclease/exonuclease/phosphatase family metal-dependent hydrolase
MLITFPVIFIDFGIFSGLLARAHPTPRRIAAGIQIGVIFMILAIFMNIFSNTWGYVEPISPFFRNKFWIAFLLITALVTILAIILSRRFKWFDEEEVSQQNAAILGVFLGAVFLVTLISALLTDRYPVPAPIKNSLKVMTFNIQQANDVNGEKSYLDQLKLIKEVDADIIGFQESDSTRISLGNNDYIRYYANKLGYHAYFGPKSVTGTYGTAILSKYPLENPRSVFTYSDQDEIGTAEAEIQVGDRQFTIFNVHPDGSDEATLVFAMTLVNRANVKADAIAIGDYNLRGWEEPYMLIDEFYKNAWMDIYPSGINEDGLDMSGENRIDHIFISPHLEVINPVYVLPPESRTDHPVHWAEISW